MYKKILISLMIFTIFFISIPKKNVSANPVLARVVGGSVGERVLVAVAEKAGQRYGTKKASKQAVERWNMELYEDLQNNHSTIDLTNAEAFKNLSKADIVPIEGKPGFGKVLISSAMFLTGADIMTDVYHSILTAYNKAEMLETIADLTTKVEEGKIISSYGGASAMIQYGYWHFGVPNRFTSLATPSYMNPQKPLIIDIKKIVRNEYWKTIALTFSATGIDQYNNPYTLDNRELDLTISDLTEEFNLVKSKVEALPNIQEVPWLQPFKETGATPQWFPKTVEVEIPITDSDWSTETPTPWNEPLLEPQPSPGENPSKNPIVPGSPVLPDMPTIPGKEPVAPSDPVAPVDPVKDAPGEELTLWDWLKNLLNKILEWLKAIWKAILSIPSFLLDWFKYFGQLLSWIGDLIASFFSWLGEWFLTIINSILSIPSLIGEGLQKLFIPSDPIGDLVEPVITDFKEKFNTPKDFAFLSPSNLSGNGCSIEDKYVTVFGVEAKIIDSSFLIKYSKWFKPIISAFFWFMFGWWLFRRMNMMASKNGGVSW